MGHVLDHRQIADEMGIFFIDAEVGAGLPIWLPNGVVIRDQLEAFMREIERRRGYQRVVSPHLAKRSLYEKSGHLQFYQDDMYPSMRADGDEFFLRPMNCPHHHKIFASRPRSYRELPLRLAEYGQVYRHERSGALRGLCRVRGLCQNDAHIYVDPVQALDEVSNVLDLHEECYRRLGLSGHSYRLSLSGNENGEAIWHVGEELLRKALSDRGLSYVEAPGEAAFYGPKIDVQMRMADGREESIASLQLDLFSADRFGLEFVSSSGDRRRPWIIHRAPLGSHERFVAILLEMSAGRLPGWLAPIQLAVIPMSEAERSLAEALAAELQQKGVRVQVDRSLGSLGKRLREIHKLRPFARVVLGQKERESLRVGLEFRDVAVECRVNEIFVILQERLRPPLDLDV